jgi:TPR repeat protein
MALTRQIEGKPKMQLVVPFAGRYGATMDQTSFRQPISDVPPYPVQAPESHAEQGGAEAQFHLGLHYANCAEGLEPNYKVAIEWYRKAAEQNHALAEFNLGVMYASGHGVTPDAVAAQVWFGKSASRGDAGAQNRLGVAQFQASLQGPLEDRPEARIEAFKWFQLAARQGYVGSEAARDEVTLLMTSEDVAEAVQRADRFVPLRP